MCFLAQPICVGSFSDHHGPIFYSSQEHNQGFKLSFFGPRCVVFASEATARAVKAQPGPSVTVHF